MSAVMLCRRQSTALFFTSIAHDVGLLHSKPQPNEAVFLDQIHTWKPPFAILTHNYIDGPGLFVNLRQLSSNTCIVLCVLPDAPSLEPVWSLLDTGAIDTLCSLAELPDCLRTLMADRLFGSSLLKGYPYNKPREPLPGWNDLTEAEKRVLKLMAEGLTGPQIADSLHISPKTVDNHKSKISQKLNVSGGPGSLTRFALKNSSLILSLPD